MSNTIQIKRSSTAASVPTAGQLAVGELAVNLADRKLFTKNASNAVVELTKPDPTNGFSFRNRIINGDLRIDQRNNGASVTPTNGQYLLDRYQGILSQASKYSVQQVTDAPVGFTNSMRVTSLSAYSVVASDIFHVMQKIEGFNVSDLAWGTANAQAVTVSFWAKSSLTGTFGGSLVNSAEDRSYPFTYTISSANTWEYKTVAVAGDTTGTWLTNNGIGIRCHFTIGMGSNYTATAGAWTAGAKFAPTGATNLVATNGATLAITGVQLEAGSVATPFERRPYGTELALCQRYAQVFRGLAGAGEILVGSGIQKTTTTANFYTKLTQTMRSAPTATFTSITVSDQTSWSAAATLSSINAGTDSVTVVCSYSANGAQYRPVFLTTDGASAVLAFSSEL
jgi:hypothetical protein